MASIINKPSFVMKRVQITGTTDANGNLSLYTEDSKALVLFAWNGTHVFIPFYYGNSWYARVQRTDASGTAMTNTAITCDIYYI